MTFQDVQLHICGGDEKRVVDFEKWSVSLTAVKALYQCGYYLEDFHHRKYTESEALEKCRLLYKFS